MRLDSRLLLPRRIISMVAWLPAAAGLAAVPSGALAATTQHGTAPSTRARASATRSPASNRTLSQATLWTCEVNPTGPGCVSAVLTAINRARGAEGVRTLRLPAGFVALSVPAQLVAIGNLERSDRGLTPSIGLSRSLDQNALAAARADQDPVPNPFYGNAYGSNWAGGIGSTLAVDFLWMYDDGPGSSNIDCRSAQSAGCWGHRQNILAPYQSPLVMGAAVSGTSMTEVFVGGDGRTRPGQPDAPLALRAVR
ncbi:MAG TPA: hypothetical protein VG325_03685 [Solirubrobacteraceae bacterium]|nr:hypothetical protein [Solirubrobacteraceae bacterium]